MTSLSASVSGLTHITFEGRARSSCRRSLENGGVTRFPCVTLYVRSDLDRCRAGLAAEQGNWDDSWSGTRSIRDQVNTVLRQHGFPSDDISDQTFVFVKSLEPIVFDRIGRAGKEDVGQVILRQTGLEPSHLFWSSGGTYHAVWRDRDTCQRIGRWARWMISRQVTRLVSNLDPSRLCRARAVRVVHAYIGQEGVHLDGLSRED